MIAVVRLVLLRLRARGRSALLIVLALAAAIGVLGAISGVAVLTEDRAAQDALARLPVRDRSVFVNRYAENGRDHGAADRVARAALERVGDLTEPVFAASIIREPFRPTVVLAVDDLARWATIVDGRLPAPCDGGEACEAIRFGESNPFFGARNSLAGMSLQVVGTAQLRPDFPIDPPFDNGDVIAVDGLAAAGGPTLASIARADIWVAPLDSRRVRGWNLDRLVAVAQRTARDLELVDSSFVTTVPSKTIADVRARAGAAGGRLVLIGSLTAAMLLAFAVFAAAIGRHDIGQEYRRLGQHGARLRELLALVVLEAVLPSLAGAALGAAIAVGAVAALATWQGAPVGDAIAIALGSPTSLAVLAGVAVLAALAVCVGIHPALGRAISLRLVAVAIAPVGLVLAWDLATRGPLGRDTLASRAVEPMLVLLPAAAGLTAIVGGLVLLPIAFRFAARRLRRGSSPARLAVVSLASEPELPAAALVLMTFSLGAIVFAAGYGATLRQGAADQAAFEAGMDLLAVENDPDFRRADVGFGHSVLPFDRFERLGDGIDAFPVARLDLATGTQRATSSVVGLGLPPELLERLRGWRADFSANAPAELAGRLRLAGDWQLQGHDLPADSERLTLRLDADGDQVRLSAVIRQPDGNFTRVTVGDLGDGPQTLEVELPPEAIGGRIVAFAFNNGGASAIIGPEQGRVQRSRVVFHDVPGVRGAEPVDVEVSGAFTEQIVRPPQRTDDVEIPAIVSPGLAGLANEGGRVPLQLSSGGSLAVRVAGVATRFPTVMESGRDFAVLPLEPFLVAVNAARPGLGVPGEAWIAAGSPAATAAATATLASDPFRVVRLTSRTAGEAGRRADPFAEGVVWALAIAAFAALVLAAAGLVLAAAVHLRDERGELAELEAQGLRPEWLALMSVARMGWLMMGGTVVGIALGVALTQVAVGAIAIAANAVAPIPPLVVVQGWPISLVVVATFVAIVGVSVGILVARHFRGEEGRLGA